MDPKYVVLYAIKAITVIAIVMVISISLHGCGSCSRNVAMITGVSRECVDGVEYLQFPSGVSVAYNLDGSIKQCSKK